MKNICENFSSRRDKILDVLRKAKQHWLEKDPVRGIRIDERSMKVALRMLLPNDKVEFVIGKQREKLKIIEVSCCVKVNIS
jgi:hypothetical protein